MDARELGAQTRARHRIERAERLVHQEKLRIGRERPRHADALLLPAGQLMRIFASIFLDVEPQQGQQLAHASADPVLGPREQPRHGRDVVFDRPMGEQSERLHDVADPPPQHLGPLLPDIAAGHADRARRGRDEPVDHLE